MKELKLLVYVKTFPIVLCLFTFVYQVDCRRSITGYIPMGLSNDLCDNAKDNLDVDWNNSTDYEYICQSSETPLPVVRRKTKISCVDQSEIPVNMHHCMFEALEYEDQPPTFGSHRPLWPVYGEYMYVPPQRWLHSAEHGAAIFLYHPCANQFEVDVLKTIARECLRRHIITPYRHLPLKMPFAVITYGCKMLMSYVNKEAVKTFVKEHALQAPEGSVSKEGQYSFGLLKIADNVTDFEDSELCPTKTTFDGTSEVLKKYIF